MPVLVPRSPARLVEGTLVPQRNRLVCLESELGAPEDKLIMGVARVGPLGRPSRAARVPGAGPGGCGGVLWLVVVRVVGGRRPLRGGPACWLRSLLAVARSGCRGRGVRLGGGCWVTSAGCSCLRSSGSALAALGCRLRPFPLRLSPDWLPLPGSAGSGRPFAERFACRVGVPGSGAPPGQSSPKRRLP